MRDVGLCATIKGQGAPWHSHRRHLPDVGRFRRVRRSGSPQAVSSALRPGLRGPSAEHYAVVGTGGSRPLGCRVPRARPRRRRGVLPPPAGSGALAGLRWTVHISAPLDVPASFAPLARAPGGARCQARRRGTAALLLRETPPSAFPTIVLRIREGRFGRAGSYFEKPIGHDLASARELAQVVGEVFDESRVFGIDHYVARRRYRTSWSSSSNSMVEQRGAGFPAVADHVQITVAASHGIAGRGRYYEEAGALRDMVQNHLLQVLAFVAMEPPDSLAPEDVRDRKAELLEAVRPFSADELVGQYVAGVVEGREVPGYPDEERVSPGRPSRRSSPCGPGWTTRVGRESPSCYAPASACPAGD